MSNPVMNEREAFIEQEMLSALDSGIFENWEDPELLAYAVRAYGRDRLFKVTRWAIALEKIHGDNALIYAKSLSPDDWKRIAKDANQSEPSEETQALIVETLRLKRDAKELVA